MRERVPALNEDENEYESLKREIESLKKRVLKYKMAGAALIALGVYMLFLALLLLVAPAEVGIGMSAPLLYSILAGLGAVSFAFGLYLFGAS